MGVILVRHTRPAVAEGICYGRTDLDCADDFTQAAAAVIAALPPAVRLFSSPLWRCRRLAQAIGEARGLTPVIDARLAEMDFGAWEALAWDAVPRDQLDGWAADFHHARAHGGESVAMLAVRVSAALADIRAHGDAIVVTHMGVIRAALAAAGGPGAWQAKVPFGGIVTI